MINQQQDTLEQTLYDHFGYAAFRSGQKEIIQEVMEGNDVLGILPTGSGKSLCYQLPAKLLKGTTIVVSPLISLMIDQVKQLKAMKFKSVVALNSFMHPNERRQVYRQLQSYDLIYVSPELLQQQDLLDRLRGIHVRLFVIDEAHCISQWGHEFRPDYLKLSNIIEVLHNPTIMALSATATKDVQQDIVKFLERPNMVKRIFPMDRENIIFAIQEVNDNQEKMDVLLKLFQQYKIPTIIYFSSRQSAETIASILRLKLPDQRVAFYHGGMEQTDRVAIQQQFMNDQLDIICCTSAFGMGIDKSNIRLVIHYHFPSQIESYIQEVGRAGRDGELSVGLLLYSQTDRFIPDNLIKKELPSVEQLSTVFERLMQCYHAGDLLSANMEEVARDFELSEIQWRFLHYQFEKHGMIVENRIIYDNENWQQAFVRIQYFIEERTTIKERKLMEMIDWIHEQGCLREQLYKGFQDSYTKPKHACCSNCGFSFSAWAPQQEPSIEQEATWQEKLHRLLIVGDHNG
ncbi:RecQ family ATP-dependent DNA helicase [Lentibacillus sp. Marseille-P4043]|uniref:RecQ family ATP-dependent DNA helicase n=1 Tax=Lentibacillus sp. Marseille-P4043 TaxID=2040293 RepID=UPI000D0B7546|nr:ATP-dependent DNA helicase RecQ [Lentibacillus sp. Marseille-P4043]